MGACNPHLVNERQGALQVILTDIVSIYCPDVLAFLEDHNHNHDPITMNPALTLTLNLTLTLRPSLEVEDVIFDAEAEKKSTSAWKVNLLLKS